MTLSGLNGHFTSNFDYYDLPLSIYLLIFTVELGLHDHRRSAGSRVADRDPPNIWIHGKLPPIWN